MTIQPFAHTRCWIVAGLALSALPLATAAAAVALESTAKLNVLLICVDDLRCETGCYGVKGIRTPNIDRLAREGRMFTRHYVHAAACGPSRCAMLTSQRTQSWDVWNGARKLKPEPALPVSLPHLFKRNGYTTVCLGKVSHEPGGVMDEAQLIHQIPFSWDRASAPTGEWKTPWRAFFAFENGRYYNRKVNGVKDSPPLLPYERPESADSDFPDTLNADAAISELQRLRQEAKPFFLAVGFYKPHLPFVAPQRHWDMYKRDAIPPAPHPKPAARTKAAISLHRSYEPTTHYHWPEGSGKISAQSGRVLKHAYWAAVSYTDEQIGRVLDACRNLGLEKDTIVVLWSDHGWHLGDHGIWGKATHHEVALRSPLIIRIPGQPMPGAATRGLVESIDLYPTLAELCGLEVPPHLQGKSNVALVRDPLAPGRSHTLGIWKNGRSIRTDHHRYVEWKDKQGKIIQQELYELKADPMETANTASNHPDLVRMLSKQLSAALSQQN
jgi:iduronate 2-sulfatase